MSTKAAPEPAVPSSADRPRQQVAASTAQQIKLPKPTREIRAEARPDEDATHNDRAGVNPSDSPTTTSKLIAGAVEQSRGHGYSNTVTATSTEGQPDQRPTQGTRPGYAYNPQPDYPMLLREQGVGGVVRLRVWVDSDGRPVEIKLTQGSDYLCCDGCSFLLQDFFV
jgi:protein TonB